MDEDAYGEKSLSEFFPVDYSVIELKLIKSPVLLDKKVSKSAIKMGVNNEINTSASELQPVGKKNILYCEKSDQQGSCIVF